MKRRAKILNGIASPCSDGAGNITKDDEFAFGGFTNPDVGDIPGSVVRLSFTVRTCEGFTTPARFQEDLRRGGFSLLGELRLEPDGSLRFFYLPPPYFVKPDEPRGDVIGDFLFLEKEIETREKQETRLRAAQRGLDQLFE